MTREVSIFSNPVAAPGVCGKCGSQDKDWFVDLGFETEMQKFEPQINLPIWLDGVLYLCCDCVNSLYTDLLRKFPQFEDNHYVRTNLHGYERHTDSDEHDSVPDEPDFELNGNGEHSESDNSEVESEPFNPFQSIGS